MNTVKHTRLRRSFIATTESLRQTWNFEAKGENCQKPSGVSEQCWRRVALQAEVTFSMYCLNSENTHRLNWWPHLIQDSCLSFLKCFLTHLKSNPLVLLLNTPKQCARLMKQTLSFSKAQRSTICLVCDSSPLRPQEPRAWHKNTPSKVIFWSPSLSACLMHSMRNLRFVLNTGSFLSSWKLAIASIWQPPMFQNLIGIIRRPICFANDFAILQISEYLPMLPSNKTKLFAFNLLFSTTFLPWVVVAPCCEARLLTRYVSRLGWDCEATRDGQRQKKKETLRGIPLPRVPPLAQLSSFSTSTKNTETT